MSVQAGIWNWDGKPVSREWLAKLDEQVAEYGPDGMQTCTTGCTGVLFRAFHTTADSKVDRQPWVGPNGCIVTWDGRLDNRDQLRSELRLSTTNLITDVEIVSKALDQWGTTVLNRLVGDWALVQWQPLTQTLLLATDFSGLRRLYYHATKQSIVWCTTVEPIVLLSGSRFTLNEDYVAGFLVSYPPAYITAFREICPVPAGHYVMIEPHRITVNQHWRLSSNRRLRYKTDAEYEEHFRHLFRQSVKRRLRSDTTILADLSGGLDSSSIVCTADEILREGNAGVVLDTLSFFDAKEPLGDEREYIAIVEAQRGKVGHHLDLARYGYLLSLKSGPFTMEPRLPANDAFRRDFCAFTETNKYRVFLSGFGGDELLGGVPDPRFQLADLFVTLRWSTFWRQLFAWSVAKKAPWIKLFRESLTALTPGSLGNRIRTPAQLPRWINRQFARERLANIRTHDLQHAHRFWLPTRREYAMTISAIVHTIAHSPGRSLPKQERRYPYLDRDLVDFLMSVPASQLLRPGQRRSLMRRSLRGIVPSEILWRRTKGSTGRSHLIALQNSVGRIVRLMDHPISEQMGFIDGNRFREDLARVTDGRPLDVVAMLKEVSLEFWLRDLISRGLISAVGSVTTDGVSTALHFETRSTAQ